MIAPLPPFMFRPNIPDNASPSLVRAYCVIYGLFAYVMGGGMIWAFFDWHSEFKEWMWFLPILASLFIGCAVALTIIAFKSAPEDSA